MGNQSAGGESCATRIATSNVSRAVPLQRIFVALCSDRDPCSFPDATSSPQLLFDPGISNSEPLPQRQGRLPTQHLVQEGIVAVATTYTLRATSIVPLAQPLPCYFANHVH